MPQQPIPHAGDADSTSLAALAYDLRLEAVRRKARGLIEGYCSSCRDHAVVTEAEPLTLCCGAELLRMDREP